MVLVDPDRTQMTI